MFTIVRTRVPTAIPSMSFSPKIASSCSMGFKALLIAFLFLLHVDARGEAVALISPQAKDFVGQQLSSFQVDADGVISSTENRYLRLNNTQGKSFKLSGQVWLGGPSADSTFLAVAPDGFVLRLRQISMNHTFRLSSQFIQVDRVKANGIVDDQIDQIATFDKPVLNTWIPFSVEATFDHITYQFGSQNGSIPGPWRPTVPIVFGWLLAPNSKTCNWKCWPMPTRRPRRRRPARRPAPRLCEKLR